MCVSKKGGIVYNTYYNDIDFVYAACKFTVAHEIKHVVSGDCVKGENELTESDEILADYFAKCLLAPQVVILNSKLKMPDDYTEYFGLSNQASVNWFGAVEKRKCRYGSNTLFDYEKEFLYRVKHPFSSTMSK